MGHVMRCIAIAQALVNFGFSPIFVCRRLEGNAIEMIREHGFNIFILTSDTWKKDAEELLTISKKIGIKNILVDLSHQDTLGDRDGFVFFLNILTQSKFKVSLIEGMRGECISLDLPLPVANVIVPYFGADKFSYKLAPESNLYVGERFFPLRSEFLKLMQKSRITKRVAKNILVTLGGGDIGDFNGLIIEALMFIKSESLSIKVVGSFNTKLKLGSNIEVIPYTKNIAELMLWADFAVIGSGLTRYETSFIGLPSIVFSLNIEHANMVKEFADTGSIIDGGVFFESSAEDISESIKKVLMNKNLRLNMRASGMSLIDGNGSGRIAKSALIGF